MLAYYLYKLAQRLVPIRAVALHGKKKLGTFGEYIIKIPELRKVILSLESSAKRMPVYINMEDLLTIKTLRQALQKVDRPLTSIQYNLIPLNVYQRLIPKEETLRIALYLKGRKGAGTIRDVEAAIHRLKQFYDWRDIYAIIDQDTIKLMRRNQILKTFLPEEIYFLNSPVVPTPGIYTYTQFRSTPAEIAKWIKTYGIPYTSFLGHYPVAQIYRDVGLYMPINRQAAKFNKNILGLITVPKRGKTILSALWMD